MQLLRRTTTAAAVISLIFLISATAEAKLSNITKILAQPGFSDFSTFNHYLSLTHLADEINSRQTITICAVDNAAMSDLLGRGFSLPTLKNVLAVHVFLDYFDAKKLHQISNGTALTATLFQTTGDAQGATGFVNITDMKGGKVAFGPENGNLSATFVKSLYENPYNICVIQISTIIPTPEAAAPTPSPSQVNLTEVMSAHGCKVFAETTLNSAAQSTFDDGIAGGLTLFCPTDDVFKAFLPKFNNLTAAKQEALLDYHGVPVYQSMPMLKSNNGVMNTLATDGASKYDFTVQNNGNTVTIKTGVDTAKVTDTLLDEQPVSIFAIDHVLLPRELFNASLAPAPAPGPAAPAPSPSKTKHKSPPAPPSADAPADSPSGDVADQNSNGSDRGDGRGFVAVLMSFVIAFFALL